MILTVRMTPATRTLQASREAFSTACEAIRPEYPTAALRIAAELRRATGEEVVRITLPRNLADPLVEHSRRGR